MSNQCITDAHNDVDNEINALGDDADTLRDDVVELLQKNPPPSDLEDQLDAIEVALDGIDDDITYQEGRDSGIDEGFSCCPS